MAWLMGTMCVAPVSLYGCLRLAWELDRDEALTRDGRGKGCTGKTLREKGILLQKSKLNKHNNSLMP